jgi:hypothetical protein
MTSLSRRWQGPAGAGLLLIGLGVGAVAGHAARPAIEMAPTVATPIRTLADGTNIVSVRGRVAETYGNKVIMDDGTGRALVDFGPQGDRRALVQPGQVVTVQGRYDRSLLHAAFLVDASGKVEALGPLGGPPPHGPGAPPPPPPGAGAPPPPPPGGPGAPPPPPVGAGAPPPPPPVAQAAPAVPAPVPATG